MQGDVVKLVEQTRSGKVYTLTTVASYTYNAWGEILTSSGTMSEINPLRYRGYYYDTETGFYYLQSRYYDPAMHRFINADSLASTGQGILGTNMFAYCLDNPVNYLDSAGTVAMTFGVMGNDVALFGERRYAGFGSVSVKCYRSSNQPRIDIETLIANKPNSGIFQIPENSLLDPAEPPLDKNTDTLSVEQRKTLEDAVHWMNQELHSYQASWQLDPAYGALFEGLINIGHVDDDKVPIVYD